MGVCECLRVRVSKCMHMLCPVEGEMAVYMPSDGEENGMSCDGEEDGMANVGNEYYRLARVET